MRIHCLQHVSFETPGTIVEWAGIHHHAITYTYFFAETFSLPLLSEVDVLLIMGGPMNVDEEEKYPWLKAEKQFIKQAIDAGKKTIGICLGAQLMATVWGKKVVAGAEKEIGFFPVLFTEKALQHPFFNHFSNPCPVFHWHGDTFDLLDNALLVASSPACKNQAYLINEQQLGLQFHFELNEPLLENMLLHEGHELEEKGKYIQSAGAMKKQKHYMEQNRKDLFLLLDKFLPGT